MIDLQKIKLHNFLSFEDEEFSFQEGKYLILGRNKDSQVSFSNGAGKSSLFDAVVFAIYGKADRNYQRYGTDDTYVELEFIYNNDLYKIIRYFNHKVYKNKLELYRNGEYITFHTKKQTQEFINKIFTLSYDNFISSIIYKQGLTIKLSSLTPSKRKEYFSNLVDANFSEVEKNVKLKVKLLEGEMEELKEKYNLLKQDLSFYEGKKSSILDYVEIDDKQVQIDIERLQDDINDAEHYLSQLNEKISKLEEEFNIKKSNFTMEQARYKMELSQLKKLSKGVCPLCKQKIDNIDFIRDRIKTLENLINKEFVFDKQDELNELKKIKQEIESELQEKKKDLYLLVTKYNKNKEAVKKLEEIEEKCRELERQVKEVEEILVDKEFDYGRYKEFYNLVKPSGELRTILLINYIDVYNQILSSIVEQLFPENKDIKIEIDDKMQGLVVKGINYDNLSGGEKRRLDFAFQIAFSDFISMINNFDINIRVFDEVADGLDEKSLFNILNYINDLFDNKAVYFISHNENLKSFFSDVIYVEKEDGVSKIVRE
jgi:DNA repair exonuclease SbcCD ATPase subunit